MKGRRKRTGCLIVVLLALIVFAAFAWIVLRSPIKRASRVSPAILDLVDQAEVMLDPVREYETPYGYVELYAAELDNGDAVLFDVDEDGQVVGYFAENQKNTAVALSIEEAIQVAQDFALAHYSDPQILASPPEHAELVGKESSFAYYRIVWAGRDEQSGAYLPQSVCVNVNAATGDVTGYSQVNEPVQVDTDPQIGRESAEQTAVRTAADYLDEPTVLESKLVVVPPGFVPDRVQALLWEVIVEGTSQQAEPSPRGAFYVDAVSGDVVLIEPFL